jgi:hypothetical protein
MLIKLAEYKPLLFTTTLRNPERLRDFLLVLKKYDGEILTNDIINKVVRDLIKNGLYQPNYVKRNKTLSEKMALGINFSDMEVEEIIANSPQRHKEAGFDKGWPSRFDTWYKLAKVLGFVFYELGEKITFSKIGSLLVDDEHPEFEQQAFLNALVKYQRNNPFKRVLNENAPLVLLLQVIRKINEDPEFNQAGITRQEIPLLLFWRDNNTEALYLKIKQIRNNYGYEPSNEVILAICDELTGGRYHSMKDVTIMRDYPDEFIRKMKLSGLITIRGFGKFIDINSKEENKIEYIIKEYSKYKKYKSKREYFDYASSIDDKLISFTFKPEEVVDVGLLKKWIDHYKWEKIKHEMLLLSEDKSSKDEVLKFIPGPLRLEFLTTLAIISKYPKIIIKANYISDDEGLPSSHAPGGKPDIECLEHANCILVEVTLITGAQQNIREMPIIQRHLEDKKATNENSFSFFVSPRVHPDSINYSEWLRDIKKLNVFTISIKELLENLEIKPTFKDSGMVSRS